MKFAEHRSTVPLSDISSWTPQQVFANAQAFGQMLFEHITRDEGMREALIRFPPTYKFERHKPGLAGNEIISKHIATFCF